MIWHLGESLAGKRPCSCECYSAFSLPFQVQTASFFPLNTQAPAVGAKVMPLALEQYFLCLQWYQQISLNHLMLFKHTVLSHMGVNRQAQHLKCLRNCVCLFQRLNFVQYFCTERQCVLLLQHIFAGTASLLLAQTQLFDIEQVSDSSCQLSICNFDSQ